ncbi:MAG: putative phage regulatory protein [Pseudomonadota bacterium]|jgi:hypothetical protein
MYLSYVIVNIKEVLYYIVINVWYLAMSDNQKDPQYKLRWSEELRDKVMLSAKEQNRSINQEIVARLEKSFESDGNQVMLLEEDSIRAMEDMMSNILENAVNNLLQQGVDRDVVQNAFTSKAKKPT